MAIPLDLAIYDSGGQLAAVAEVKAKRGTTRDWAAQFRRNLLAHGAAYRPTFFLIVTPDRIYLWKDAGSRATVVDPDYEIDARPVFKPYFDAAHIGDDQISGPAFEIIVASWLNHLTWDRGGKETTADASRALVDSGFLTSLRGGKVEQEVAV